MHRLGSLGAAARELRISQPTATMLLHELEEVFGAKLVDRGPRGARLTMAGLRALERLSIALVSVERGIEAAAAPDLAPVLRLGCVQTAGVKALPSALARLEQAGHVQRRHEAQRVRARRVEEQPVRPRVLHRFRAHVAPEVERDQQAASAHLTEPAPAREVREVP